MAGVYFHTLPDAIKEAKSRARSHHTTYYIYRAMRELPNLFCSIKPPAQWPLEVKAKVLYDGSITYFGKAEEEHGS